MAIDNTPPRLKLIITIAVITVITLIGINFVLESYYAMMTDTATREKLAPTIARDEQRKAELTALTNASVPIEQAMAQLGKGTRPEAITPQPSEDLGPLTGWSKLPKPAPAQHAHVDAPVPAVTGDAGAALLAGDAGVHAAAGDAGVHTATGDAGVRAAGDAGVRHLPRGDGGAR